MASSMGHADGPANGTMQPVQPWSPPAANTEQFSTAMQCAWELLTASTQAKRHKKAAAGRKGSAGGAGRPGQEAAAPQDDAVVPGARLLEVAE